MISINDNIEPGILKLQSRAKPPLAAGTYALNAEVKLYKVDDNKDVIFNNKSTSFSVSAPRFVLEPSLIHSVYPLSNSKGAFHTSLPHIIFTRKTLPWERQITDDANIPWFTLLLLSDDEMEQYKVTVSEMPAGKITDNNEDKDVVKPVLKAEDWEKNDANVSVLQLPFNLFQKICAKKDELSYLAHTRQVDMSDKENAGSNPKGWFSAVTCNRLPQRGKHNTVFLVSLEGHYESLVATSAPAVTIRLVVLNKWAFDDEGVTFEELIGALTENVSPLRIDSLDDINNSAGAISKFIAKALKYGYTPISHNLRNGKMSVSWYRSPLVPVDIPSPQLYKYEDADEALRFDADTGMFDISYAAAWQLGRLMALKSPGFATLINNWKEDFKREKPLNIAKEILEKEPGIEIDPDDLASVINEVESDEILTDFIIELWNRP
jgi:hypothetical protein